MYLTEKQMTYCNPYFLDGVHKGLTFHLITYLLE